MSKVIQDEAIKCKYCREMLNMNHLDYINRREELSKIRSESIDSFDKAILTLTTGGLALSITFLDKIGKPFNLCTFNLISSCWIVFSVVIVVNLFSFIFAQWNMECKINDLDVKYQACLDFKKNSPNKEPPDVIEVDFWQKTATNVCNYSSLGLFLLGVSLFVTYIVMIQKNEYQKYTKDRSNMSERKTNAKTEIKAPITIKKVVTKIHTAGKTEIAQAIIKPIVKPSGSDK